MKITFGSSRTHVWNCSAEFEPQDNGDVKFALASLAQELLLFNWTQIGPAIKEARNGGAFVCGVNLTIKNIPKLGEGFELGEFPFVPSDAVPNKDASWRGVI